MNLILGISHPKHVYIFKNLYFKLKEANHKPVILASNKEMTCDLLNQFEMDYVLIGSNRKGIYSKLFQVIKFFFITLYYALKTKTHIFIGFGYIHFALVAFILRKPFIFLEDTEVAKSLHKVLMPFVSSFLTTKNFKNKISSKQISINANLELAYLHPKHRYYYNQFSHIKPYVLLRFVSWSAFHDVRQRGISKETKERLIRELSLYANVYIASEKPLPEYLKKYALKVNTAEIHDFVTSANLVVGESPTMTTESAILGTPAICVSSWACHSLGNFKELRDYNLIYCYLPEDEKQAVDKAVEIIKNPALKESWKKKAEQFIKDRIDLTTFLFWFIIKYPDSHKVIKDNPDIQNEFR